MFPGLMSRWMNWMGGEKRENAGGMNEAKAEKDLVRDDADLVDGEVLREERAKRETF